MNVEKLRTLWDLHAKAIHGALLQITRSPQDASDLLQDVFCRLARQPELLAGLPEEPRGFLLRLSRNLAIDHLRRLQARDRVYEKAHAADNTAVDAEDPDHPLLKQALAAALEHLPAEQRDVVHDRLWKRRTLDEIAAARGISINTAASRYRYGLDKMRDHLRPLYADFSTNPLSLPDHAMKPNPRDPIIRPLDQRRVPSATGLFSLPVLPQLDDVDLTVEEIEAPVEAVIDPEIIDVPLEGKDLELPITFEEVIGEIDGEPSADADADLDVVWAYQEIFTLGNVTLTSEEEDGEGDETDQTNQTGNGQISGSGGTVVLGPQTLTTSNSANFGGRIEGGSMVLNGTTSGSLPSGVLTSPSGGDSVQVTPVTPPPTISDDAPLAESRLIPATAIAPLPVVAETQADGTDYDFARPIVTVAHDLDHAVTHASASPDQLMFISTAIASQDDAPEGGSGVFGIEGNHESVIEGDFTGQMENSALFDSEDATVEQWVPLPAFRIDRITIDLPVELMLADLDQEPAVVGAEVTPGTDADAASSTHGVVIAATLTAAALAAYDPKPAGKGAVRRALAMLIAFLSLLSSGMAATPSDTVQPKISRLKGKVVTVTVPAGFDSVSLQNIRVLKLSKTRTQRVWGTMDTQFPSAQATTLTFRLTRLIPRKNLRVIGSRSSPLPENFLSGVTSFGGDSLSLTSNTTSTNGGVVARTGDVVTLSSGVTTANFSGDSLTTSGSTAPATVVESDIWKIDGDRLYYFNQLRGLQVIDVSKPDDPALLGTLRMPASGEDLYVLDKDHVALLKRASNWWGWGGFITIRPISIIGRMTLFDSGATLNTTTISAAALSATATGSLSLSAPATTLLPYSETERSNELVIADVSDGTPKQVASVPFTGSLLESRLVGQVLYVAVHTTRTTDPAVTEYGTKVTAFDVSDPTDPRERDSVFVPGSSSMVTATSDYFVVTANYPSTLQLVDISAGDGTLKLVGSIAPEGYVADKFKIDVDGDVLTVISQASLPWVWNETTQQWSGGGQHTVLQTFSLANPDAPAPLGRLLIAPGETLRATRFDSGKVYVVTFVQIDPLHVVDLSDPANPTISGEVQAPGFSTYIEPLGDRLVTIGLVNWKPAVSLFDVSDPAAPKLLQQLELGARNDGWSQSEAVWNEKAFKVLPQHNLVLLPISGYDRIAPDQWGSEWFARVQLIDLKRDSLTARGIIDANFSPRRADVIHANRIAAISPSKLVVVNAGNRDQPKVTAEVELAWSVDRVLRVGNYLLQVGRHSNDWYTGAKPTLSVGPAADPDSTLTSLDLDPLEVVGSTLKDGTLYLAQRAWPQWWLNTNAADKPQLLVTAYDVSALPALRKLSQASGPALNEYWTQYTALWPSPGTLVWSGYGHYRSAERMELRRPAGSTVVDNDYARWWGAWSRLFVSFNVSAPAKIAFTSRVELEPTNPCQLAEPHAQAGLVFISEQHHWDSNLSPDVIDAGKHFLRVIDYTQPAVPFVREERVNIPGRLVGVDRGGKLLYTAGSDLDTTTGAVRQDAAALHASAFDGAAAHLIATHPLPSAWAPIAFSGPNAIFLDQQPAQLWKPYVWKEGEMVTMSNTLSLSVMRGDYYSWWGHYEENPLHSKLHIALLTDAGSFTELSSLEVAHDSGLRLFGDLAVTQPDYRSVRALDLSNKLAPADLGAFTLPGSVWPNLEGADGALGVGLWIATGSYGVETVNLAE